MYGTSWFQGWHEGCGGQLMRGRLGLIIGCVAALCGSPASATGQIQEFPFELREGLIWIKVQVATSAAPLNFLLDSGAAVSVLNLRTTARLGIKPGHRVSVQGVGSRTDGFWPAHVSAAAGNVALPKNYLVADLGALSGSCQCPVDGLIGADFLRNQIVQIDFANRRIRLLAEAPSRIGEQRLAFKEQSGALLVPVRVNQEAEQWVRLDTGCASDLQWVTDSPDLAARTQRMAIALTKVSLEVAQTSVQLGSTRFEAVPTDLHRTPIFAGEAGLLGNGLLARFSSVTIDAKAGNVILFF